MLIRQITNTLIGGPIVPQPCRMLIFGFNTVDLSTRRSYSGTMLSYDFSPISDFRGKLMHGTTQVKMTPALWSSAIFALLCRTGKTSYNSQLDLRSSTLFLIQG